jgi:hypothetical protein
MRDNHLETDASLQRLDSCAIQQSRRFRNLPEFRRNRLFAAGQVIALLFRPAHSGLLPNRHLFGIRDKHAQVYPAEDPQESIMETTALSPTMEAKLSKSPVSWAC